MERRPTFGLFVDWLEDEYQNNVLSGVEETARQQGVNLLCFAGGVLGSPQRFAARRNYVYDLATPSNVDGLLLMTGTLGNFVGLAQLARFAQRYRPLPMVSLGAELSGMPSVLVDNARGMHSLVTHLVHVHGFRRVAFIRGPEGNGEAESRFLAYRQVLEEFGLPLDPALVVAGDFQPESGAAAIRTLVDERGMSFQAVVAASDVMAIGAIDALQARGIRVPYDIAVVGFDDVESARFSVAPLTTVRQPLHEQGVHAMQHLIALQRGEPVAPRSFLRTQLYIRQSCGCPPLTTLPVAQFQLLQAADSLLATFRFHRPRLVADMAQAMRSMAGSLEIASGERLLDALSAELEGHEGVFLSTLEELVGITATLGGTVNAWQGAVAVLRHHARVCLPSDPERWARAEDLWHEARVLIGLVAERAQGQHRLARERLDRILRATGEELSTSLDLSAVARVLGERLPQLRMKSHYLVLFAGEQRPSAQARLIAAHDASGRHLPVPERTFPTHELLPSETPFPERRFTYIVEPVFYEREALGYVLLEVGPPEGVLYETVRDQLGGAVKSALLYQRALDEEGAPGSARARSALLPRDLHAPALRMAAALLAGHGSGRDYYDVFPTSDGCWVALGHLEGTGRLADLVSTLLQGAVAAGLARHADATPAEVMRVVNDVLFENVRRRMNVEPEVALLLLRYHADGRLVLTGLHPDLVIYRQSIGAWARLPARGGPIGKRREIDRRFDETAFQLEEGDLLLLASDGAANARGAHGEPLGIDRLCAELQRVRYEPVDGIRDHLVAALRSWATGGSDVTLLVARFGTDDDTLSLDEATSPGR